MSAIGPQIPAHLLGQIKDGADSEEDDGPQPSGTTNIGPELPAHLSRESKLKVYDDSDEEGEGPRPNHGPSVGPSIPSKLLKGLKKPGVDASRGIGPSIPTHHHHTSEPKSRSKQVAGPSMPPPSISSLTQTQHSIGVMKRTLGPSLPTYAPTYNPDEYASEDDDDDDDDIGPKPLPAGMQHQQPDAVQEFIDREEKRRKAAEDASKPKAPQRDEWMLVPPTSSGLLGNLDPTKLKARQFSRSAASSGASSKNDTSLWTETPAERQQRLADEVSGKKRRVTDAPVEAEDEKSRKRRRKAEEEAIRRGVDDYTRSKRGGALVDQHASTIGTKPVDTEVPGIWDHSRDMGLGGRLMDDEKRGKMLKEAKGLGDRFGSGNSGGFL